MGVESFAIVGVSVIFPALVVREIIPRVFGKKIVLGTFVAVVLSGILSYLLFYLSVDTLLKATACAGMFCGLEYLFLQFLVIPLGAISGVLAYAPRFPFMVLLLPEKVFVKLPILRFMATLLVVAILTSLVYYNRSEIYDSFITPIRDNRILNNLDNLSGITLAHSYMTRPALRDDSVFYPYDYNEDGSYDFAYVIHGEDTILNSSSLVILDQHNNLLKSCPIASNSHDIKIFFTELKPHGKVAVMFNELNNFYYDNIHNKIDKVVENIKIVDLDSCKTSFEYTLPTPSLLPAGTYPPSNLTDFSFTDASNTVLSLTSNFNSCTIDLLRRSHSCKNQGIKDSENQRDYTYAYSHDFDLKEYNYAFATNDLDRKIIDSLGAVSVEDIQHADVSARPGQETVLIVSSGGYKNETQRIIVADDSGTVFASYKLTHWIQQIVLFDIDKDGLKEILTRPYQVSNNTTGDKYFVSSEIDVLKVTK